MNRISQIFWSCLQDDSGQDLVEYALVVCLLGLGAAATMRSLAGNIATTLTGLGTKLTTSV